jgi:hypothetical protein
MTISWVKMGQAGELLNMTPKGAKLRLHRMQASYEIQFLRKIGDHWEVNVDILKQLLISREDHVDVQFKKVHSKVDALDARVTALRNVGKKFRKNTEKRLDEHEKQLNALKQLAAAANLVVESFSGAERTGTNR